MEALWIVRHGESAGNVARDRAHAAGARVIEIAERDLDVPLSRRGERQARALGDWFRALPADQRPTRMLASPHLRARHTAEIVAERAGLEGALRIDERLREKELGLLDRLTRVGIEERFPEHAELRARIGKFYYRPPSGESWCDVVLRLRSLIDSLEGAASGERVLIVTHQVVVSCMRYILESLSEVQILAIDRAGEVANCSVTAYARDAGGLVLRLYNHVAPVAEGGEIVTAEPDTDATED